VPARGGLAHVQGLFGGRPAARQTCRAVVKSMYPSKKVLWALLLQLLGHVPGVIYGLYRVIED